MKKTIAVVVSLCLLFGSVLCAFADPGYIEVNGVDSKKVQDLLNTFSSNWPNMKFITFQEGDHWGIIGVRMVNKAAAATSAGVDSFFNAKSSAGEPVSITGMLGAEKADILEMFPVGIEGYEEAMGDVDMVVTCAVPIVEGEKIAVVIGLCEEGAQAVAENEELDLEWTVFEGKGIENDAVAFTLPGNFVADIQETGGAILSVVRAAYDGE